LSGDPYLPQIRATTFDVGMRGTVGESMKWNLGAYQTDLKDDIYFVTVPGGAGFFDTVGNTRRRGIEAGFSGRIDKARFSLNYGLTDATFQDNFLMVSNDNSSAFVLNGFGSVIQVKAGNRMPGVPLHNINASLSYDFTEKWNVGLSAVMHSESFVRGNENNEHEQGVVRSFTSIQYINNVATPVTRTVPPTTNPGKIPGYAVFNLRTSYKLSDEWTATLLVNNLFDTEYYSAGRLGRNPFSPSILGAIGPSGYNHNSDDWRSTNFIAPGAPRGIWFSLNYQFDVKK
ncbi:MAG: TonB-dependent receptor domain-containing protein, partial [Methylophilaceae bacterium]